MLFLLSFLFAGFSFQFVIPLFFRSLITSMFHLHFDCPLFSSFYSFLKRSLTILSFCCVPAIWVFGFSPRLWYQGHCRCPQVLYLIFLATYHNFFPPKYFSEYFFPILSAYFVQCFPVSKLHYHTWLCGMLLFCTF